MTRKKTEPNDNGHRKSLLEKAALGSSPVVLAFLGWFHATYKADFAALQTKLEAEHKARVELASRTTTLESDSRYIREHLLDLKLAIKELDTKLDKLKDHR